MKKRIVLGPGFIFVFFSQVVFAQGIGEYGRLLGGVGQKNSIVVPRGGAPVKEAGTSPKSRPSGVGNSGSNSIPPALTVEANEAVLYARSEEWADVMMQLSRGEKLIPMAQTVGGNTVWYMVKTQTGAIGWIKASDVSLNSIQR